MYACVVRWVVGGRAFVVSVARESRTCQIMVRCDIEVLKGMGMRVTCWL